MVICLERGADLHMAQLMPLPPAVSCFSKIQIDFTFLVPAHLGSPGQRTVKRVCVCVLICHMLRGWRRCIKIMSFQCPIKMYSIRDVVDGDGQSFPCSRSSRGETTPAELGTDTRLEKPL